MSACNSLGADGTSRLALKSDLNVWKNISIEVATRFSSGFQNPAGSRVVLKTHMVGWQNPERWGLAHQPEPALQNIWKTKTVSPNVYDIQVWLEEMFRNTVLVSRNVPPNQL
ncbi:hypothetical protein KEM48_006906 [Puccinia striiformis f. sp. tritici PST-130]|uniref:Uncharacterized protein n=1 Tax=Puccinia striiformis f. sp. tritici PST-78 TaxID=1165861 RepID=A0A0L0VCE3_9BASI|nr:hypothetical protein KEM48_006906 [Puccinia striiformis f. sp. tritici PST-130]KNE96886.1 hypothetical protein PSTG_09870 [Puccinia striiformis f. sp. tritici PST-78]